MKAVSSGGIVSTLECKYLKFLMYSVLGLGRYTYKMGTSYKTNTQFSKDQNGRWPGEYEVFCRVGYVEEPTVFKVVF